jgi:hypothetical protein
MMALSPRMARETVPGKPSPGAVPARPFPPPAPGKPSVDELGIDVAAQRWQSSGEGHGSLEVAMVSGRGPQGGEWVLMRVAGDPAGRVLVYDRHEWECFLDGVRSGEFDDAAVGGALTQEGG